MADEADSKSVASNGVWVQVPPPAPKSTGPDKSLVDFFTLKKFFFTYLIKNKGL